MRSGKNTDPSKQIHTVVSKPSAKLPRTITFTVPPINLPHLNWREWFQAQKLLFLLLLMVIAVGGGLIGSWLAVRYYPGRVVMSSVTQSQKLVKSDAQLLTSIVKTVSPSVVSINVVSTSTSSSNANLFGFTQPSVEQQSAGTGIIISSNGLVLTNRHVVPAGTTSVSVTLSNGVTLNDVSVVGRTPANDSLDIAILKINNTKGQKLTPAVIGNSDQVQVGDPVVAIGNALGQFQNTVTSGIISGFGRNISASSGSGLTGASSSETLSDMFQTDAAINEGNSGGPLLNLNGQVIGVNTALASNSQNIGFAIPINEVKGLIKEVIKTGKFERPFLGVRFVPVTLSVAKHYKLSVNHGAYLVAGSGSSAPAVVPGQPAAKAGLKAGDVIVSVNGKSVTLRNDLTGLVDQYEPGTKVTLKVMRGHKTLTIKVKLGVEPNS